MSDNFEWGEFTLEQMRQQQEAAEKAQKAFIASLGITDLETKLKSQDSFIDVLIKSRKTSNKRLALQDGGWVDNVPDSVYPHGVVHIHIG